MSGAGAGVTWTFTKLQPGLSRGELRQTISHSAQDCVAQPGERNLGAVAHIPGERGGREKWVPGSCQNYNLHYSTRNFDFSSDSGQPIQDFSNFLAATQLMITDRS